MTGTLFRAALVASFFRGAFPPVDLRAVCFVPVMSVTLRSRSTNIRNEDLEGIYEFIPTALSSDWSKFRAYDWLFGELTS